MVTKLKDPEIGDITDNFYTLRTKLNSLDLLKKEKISLNSLLDEEELIQNKILSKKEDLSFKLFNFFEIKALSRVV